MPEHEWMPSKLFIMQSTTVILAVGHEPLQKESNRARCGRRSRRRRGTLETTRDSGGHNLDLASERGRKV